MADAPDLLRPQWPAPASVLALSTTRSGGCSQPPYDSFNLGAHVSDAPADVAANRKFLSAALPGDPAIPWLEQVHGIGVVRADTVGPGTRADAVWSATPGVPCAVMTADCLPVLFCSTAGDCVAAAHAGWRGLVAGVLEATVDALPAPAEELIAWLGPAIGPGAFEVGDEVREQFFDTAAAGENAALEGCFRPAERAGHYFADLYSLARLRLARSGVLQVSGGTACTYTDKERFFSYRRDGATGRMVSLVMLVGS